MKATLEQQVTIPEGVTVAYDRRIFSVKGPKGELKRELFHPHVTITATPQQVRFACDRATRREQRFIYTFMSHLKNMMTGVQAPWKYTLKVCASHFPMTVKVEGSTLSVKNCLGEKTPRQVSIPSGVKVTAQGTDITVESIDREQAGNMASRIELITKVRNKDQRVFQDGIYITKCEHA